jgi:S-adenosylmethionine:tRNA ribosyltransferase-isomerase
VETQEIEEHHIHTEQCSLSPEVARQVNQAKLEGRRVIAVGTTSVRVLETAAQRANHKLQIADRKGPGSQQAGVGCAWQTVSAFRGSTDLFIYPGYEFRVVDALITNFHLPRSSLLMLVSAFASRELIMAAYEEAKQRRYRFYSFGDAMLIL